MLGLTLAGALGLGDKLQYSFFPENYYKNTGQKVVDIDGSWIFDHNPFVVRGEAPSRVLNLWTMPWPRLVDLSPRAYYANPVFFSIADRTARALGQVAYLRHPRLYAFEDLPTLQNRVVLHTSGKPNAPLWSSMGEDRIRVLSGEIIDHIKTRYRGYDIIQIGSKDDLDAHVTDCRGLEDIWETVKIIAQAGAFIGVDSGPSWIAACYPRVFKKKVLMQYPPEFLRASFVPMHTVVPHHHWHDFSFTYYNRTREDAGVTYSYLKL
jgi:hypothetical protein